jgi:hypothetical protein
VVTVTLITLREFSATDQPPDARLDGGQDLGHVQRRQPPRQMKPDHTGRIAREHAVEHQGVDVDIQIERSSESLNDGDGAAARLVQANVSRLVLQQAENGSEEDGRDATAQVVIPREPVSQSVR